MGVVDKDRGAERLGRLDDPGEWRDVAVHAEDAVGDDEDQAIGPAPPGRPCSTASRRISRSAATSACG